MLDLFGDRCTTLTRFDTAIAVRRRLRDDIGTAEPEDARGPALRAVSDEERQIELGWSDALRARLVQECDALLASPEWPDRVRAAFSAGDRLNEWLAWQIAPEVGVDLWNEAFTQLDLRPFDAALVSGWFTCETARASRARNARW